MKYKLTPKAQSDLEEIGDYIAQDNINAALKTVESIHQKCIFLSENPRAGRERNEVAKGLRHFPSGNYLILYRLANESVEVIRVLHGARKIEDLL